MDNRDWKEHDYIFKPKEFLSHLSPAERKKLIKNEEFQDKFVKGLGYDTFKDFTNEELKLLLDEKFIDKLSSKDEFVVCAYWFLPSEIIRDIIKQPYGYKIINFDSGFFYSDLEKYSDDIVLKQKFLEHALKANVSDEKLRSIVNDFYKESYYYKPEREKDFSVNEKEIRAMSEILDTDFSLRFYKNYDLLISLAPENRSRFYLTEKYSEMEEEDKHNLISLLKEGYEVKLSPDILYDPNFIKDVAKIETFEGYRLARLAISDLSEEASDALNLQRAKKAKEYEQIILDNNFEQAIDLGYEKFNKHLSEFQEEIFFNYFHSESRDVFIKACAIKDAMNTMPKFEDKLKVSSIAFIDKMVEILSVSKYYRDRSSVNFVEIDGDNYEMFKDLIEILRSRNDWIEMFDKTINYAKECFNTDMNNHLYSLNDKNKIKNDEGLEIYDISENKKFHLLIHSQDYEEKNLKTMFNINEQKEIFISMSLLNNNHLSTFVDNGIVFGYKDIKSDNLLHALPCDSFSDARTGSQYAHKKKFQTEVSPTMPTYIPIKDFMANTYCYNELNVEAVENATIDGNTMYKPDYIVCIDSIKESDKQVAKEYGLPIVFIDSKRVEKFPEDDYYKPMLYGKSIDGGIWLRNTAKEI